MKFLLIVYALFASYKWYSNHMAFLSLYRYMENKGDPGPSEEEVEDLISEELYRIFKRERR